jgi:vanillate O-demethylase ferredoxin subunit
MGTTNPLIQVRVSARRQMAADIAGFVLEALDGQALPAFEPGAHIDVHLPGGLVRQYSLHEPTTERGQYHIGVLRDPQSRGGSVRLADEVGQGDTLSISAPRNHFPLHKGSGESLLFAGGIGITPILCMARQLAREGRSFTLHYCGRSLSRMAFIEELRSSEFAPEVHVHVDDGAADQQLDAHAAVGSASADKHLYVCGPTGFMEHVLGVARSLGWDESHLHREYFAAAPIDHSADGTFELLIKSSGQVIEVRPDQSAAQALLDAGVAISLSCEQGVCGTCLTRVIDGAPDHRDLYLTDDERVRNDSFMPCCSRARSPRLVLDL